MSACATSAAWQRCRRPRAGLTDQLALLLGRSEAIDREEPPASLARVVRRHRTAAGLTQEELAERAGVSWRTVSDIERGVHATPRRDTLALLASALVLSAEEHAALMAARRPEHGGPGGRPLGGRAGAGRRAAGQPWI